MEINDLLHAAVDSDASDILLVTDAPPVFRIDGILKTTTLEPLDPETIRDLCDQILKDKQKETLEKQKDVDFAITIPRLGRFRFNIHVQRGTLAAAIRRYSNDVCVLDNLELPPVVEEITHLKTGLVLVTGQTGSGKSTTLAAMIEAINQRESKHIITLEDPIEYQFQHSKSLIEQREIGEDCPDFCVRSETYSQTGSGCHSDRRIARPGYHSRSTTGCRNRASGFGLIACFDCCGRCGSSGRSVFARRASTNSQPSGRISSSCNYATIELPAAFSKGRIAAAEIMLTNRAIQTSIRESTSHLIPGVISTNRRMGMQTMEQALKELLLNGKVDPEIVDEYLQELKGESPKEQSQGLLT